MCQGFGPERVVRAGEIDDIKATERPQGVELVANALQDCARNRPRAQDADIDIRMRRCNAGCFGPEEEHSVLVQVEELPYGLANGRAKRLPR